MAYRVCMVAVGKLPVPATLGGAVETLAQHLLEQNEKDPRVEFTVLTVDEPAARAQAAQFRHAKFVWFKPHILWNKVWWRVRTLGLKLTGEERELPFPYQRMEAARWLKQHHHEFDYILAESELEIPHWGSVPPEKVLYHLHWAGKPTVWRDQSFKHLLAISRYVADGWKHGTGRSEKSISVLPNCVTLDSFLQRMTSEERLQMRQTLGLSEKEFVVLYCGRLVPQKGVKELLLAVQKLKFEATLVVVGSTNFGLRSTNAYQQELYQIAQQGPNRVIFTGFVPNNELWRYYGAADVIAMPSIWQEPAGLVEVEAMAAGKPVVATRSGGIPEYLSEGCGILVPVSDDLPDDLAEALQTLRSDPGRCHAMAQAGPRAASAFSPERYYKNFVDILDELNRPE
ncbi:MAG: glycosyltransferase family 4 protein [Oscillospiraceae bacterium]|nr:glycosyltransferase family 4 protein [Oscillospiraceae bacterium]